jgi:hypothetical protein
MPPFEQSRSYPEEPGVDGWTAKPPPLQPILIDRDSPRGTGERPTAVLRPDVRAGECRPPTGQS